MWQEPALRLAPNHISCLCNGVLLGGRNTQSYYLSSPLRVTCPSSSSLPGNSVRALARLPRPGWGARHLPEPRPPGLGSWLRLPPLRSENRSRRTLSLSLPLEQQQGEGRASCLLSTD